MFLLLIILSLFFASPVFFTLASVSSNNWINVGTSKGKVIKMEMTCALAECASLNEPWGWISVSPHALPPASGSSLLHRLWLNILKHRRSGCEYRADGNNKHFIGVLIQRSHRMKKITFPICFCSSQESVSLFIQLIPRNMIFFFKKSPLWRPLSFCTPSVMSQWALINLPQEWPHPLWKYHFVVGFQMCGILQRGCTFIRKLQTSG